MRLRTLCLTIPLVYLLGSAALRAIEGGTVEEPAFEFRLPQTQVEVQVEETGESEEPLLASATFPIERAETPEQVREVLRLTRGATSEGLPALRDAALTAEDPLVAGNAVKALGRLGAFNTDAELLALIADPRERVRQDAAMACGLDGRPEAVPHLARVLEEADATLRPLALEALGRIGGAEARQLVEEVVADPGSSATERVFARAALERMTG